MYFKGQKGELELLKEKILKLEQRNSELEKKLISNNPNNTMSSVSSSKENSLNESFNNLDDSTTTTTTMSKYANPLGNSNTNTICTSSTPIINSFSTAVNSSPVKQTPPPNGLLVTSGASNGLNGSATTANSFMGQTTLNTIPNINQGGFIITSNGNITYVPPMVSAQQAPLPVTVPLTTQFTPAKACSSVVASSSSSSSSASAAASNGNSNLDNHLLTISNSISSSNDDQIKIDFADKAGLASNIDINALLTKSFSSIKPNQTSPINTNKISPSIKTNNSTSTTAAATTATPTAFIFSNGQLLPVITTPSTAPSTASLSPAKNALILSSTPTTNVPIQPKPSQLINSTPIVANKSSSSSAKSKSKSNIVPKSKSTSLTKSTSQQQLNNKPQFETPTAQETSSTTTTILTTSAVTSTSASSTTTTANNQTSASSTTATTTTTSTTTTATSGMKKPREIRPKPVSSSNLLNLTTAINKPLQTQPPAQTTGTTTPILALPKLGFNLTTPTTINTATSVVESNDILSKAASMLFSPSEFSLNSLSPPNTNSIVVNSNMSPNAGLHALTTADQLFPLLTTTQNSQLSAVPILAKPNKVPIQRKSSATTTSLSNGRKLTNLKPAISNNDASKQNICVESDKVVKGAKKTPATVSETTQRKGNKLLLPSLKSKGQVSLQPAPIITLPLPTASSQLTNGLNLIDFQKLSESLMTTSDLDSFILTSSGSSTCQPAAKIQVPISQQTTELISLDQNIQFQLQQLLNSTGNSANITLNISNGESLAISNEPACETLPNENTPKSPELMNMPSLEQFFEIESNNVNSLQQQQQQQQQNSAQDQQSKTCSQTVQPQAKKPIKAKTAVTANKKLLPLISPQSPVSSKSNNKAPKGTKTILPKTLDTNNNSLTKRKPETNLKLSVKENAHETPMNETTKSTIKTSASTLLTPPSIPEKIKFEYGDLDKVLDQVESITKNTDEESTITATNTNNATTANSYLFADLFSEQQDQSLINTSSFSANEGTKQLMADADDVNYSTHTTDQESDKKASDKTNSNKNQQSSSNEKTIQNLIKINKQSSVLSTPPSIPLTSKLNNNPAEPKKNSKTSTSTPVKSSSTKSEQTRTPLKPDNHQQQMAARKRGRPPKPANDTNKSFNENEIKEPFSDDKSDKVENNNKVSNDDEEDEENLLNDAVTNTFHELINTVTTATNDNRDDSPFQMSPRISQDKKVDKLNEPDGDFNNFVYDIATENEPINNNKRPPMTDFEQDEQTPDEDVNEFDLNQLINHSEHSMDGSQSMLANQEITIASLTLTKRKRTSNKKKGDTRVTTAVTAGFSSAKSKRRRNTYSSVYDDDQDDDELDEETNNEYENNENEETTETAKCEPESSSCPTETDAVNSTASNSNDKRKRGRPPKQTKETGNKQPTANGTNTKKGATSANLATIEYAGLTRFEIPLPFEEDTKLDQQQNNIGQTKSTNVEQKTDEHDPENHQDDEESDIESMMKKIKQTNDQNEQMVEQIANMGNVETKSIHMEDTNIQNIHPSVSLVASPTLVDTNNENMFHKSNDQDMNSKSSPNRAQLNNDETEREHQPDELNHQSEESQAPAPVPPPAVAQSDNNIVEHCNSADYWVSEHNTSGDQAQSANSNIVSHYDLENDPIISNELQLMHSSTSNVNASLNQQPLLTGKATTTNSTNLIMTPPSTVSSVSSNSSLSGSSSNLPPNQSNMPINNLSINPSSTSSNSSSNQMISPVSINGTDMTNHRSASVDPLNPYANTTTTSSSSSSGTYYPTNTQNNNQQFYNIMNPFNQQQQQQASSYQSNLNLSQAGTGQTTLSRNNNSSPQLVNVNQLYNQPSSTNNNGTNNCNSSSFNTSGGISRSHSVAPATPTPVQTLNTSQSPQNNRSSLSLSSTPIPTTTTPTPTQTPTPTTPNTSYTSNNTHYTTNNKTSNLYQSTQSLFNPSINSYSSYANNNDRNSLISSSYGVSSSTVSHSNMTTTTGAYPSYNPISSSNSSHSLANHQTQPSGLQTHPNNQQLSTHTTQLNHNQTYDSLHRHNVPSYLPPLSAVNLNDTFGTKSLPNFSNHHFNPLNAKPFTNDFMSQTGVGQLPSSNTNGKSFLNHDTFNFSSSVTPAPINAPAPNKKSSSKGEKKTVTGSKTNKKAATTLTSVNQASTGSIQTASSTAKTTPTPTYLPNPTPSSFNPSSLLNTQSISNAIGNWYDLNRPTKSSEAVAFASLSNLFQRQQQQHQNGAPTQQQHQTQTIAHQSQFSSNNSAEVYKMPNNTAPDLLLSNYNSTSVNSSSTWNQPVLTKNSTFNPTGQSNGDTTGSNSSRRQMANLPQSSTGYPTNNNQSYNASSRNDPFMNNPFINSFSNGNTTSIAAANLNQTHQSRLYQHQQTHDMHENLANGFNNSSTNYHKSSSLNTAQRSSSTTSLTGYETQQTSTRIGHTTPNIQQQQQQTNNQSPDEQLLRLNANRISSLYQPPPMNSTATAQSPYLSQNLLNTVSNVSSAAAPLNSLAHSQQQANSYVATSNYPARFNNQLNTPPNYHHHHNHQTLAHHLNQTPIASVAAAAAAAALSQNSAAAVSSYLANQFSNVSQFNWHPKI